MVKDTIRGWIFEVDGIDGIPFLRCPHCSRKISGKKVVFASIDLDKCPDCGKELHFGNIKEENWQYIDSFYGDSE